MRMAEVASTISHAQRLKVGCVAVKDSRVLSIGVNGTPPGHDNACEDENNVTKQVVIHAEANLIYKMARDGERGLGADLFITHAPCFECAKAILTVGFGKVYYNNAYRDNSGVRFLEENGVEIEQYTPETA